MKLPFTTADFLGVFESYNEGVWPLQPVFNILAASIVYLLIKKKDSERIIFSILAFFWIWMGLVYHLIFFTAINPAAWIFGFLFIAQGVIFIVYGVFKDNMPLSFEWDVSGITGMVFILYALVIYPVLGIFTGHAYPQSPTFGVPCPTTIFTFGVLLFSQRRLPWYAMTIPFLWSLIGFSAAVSLSVWEDIGLVVAGVVSALIVLFLKQKKETDQRLAL